MIARCEELGGEWVPASDEMLAAQAMAQGFTHAHLAIALWRCAEGDRPILVQLFGDGDEWGELELSNVAALALAEKLSDIVRRSTKRAA